MKRQVAIVRFSGRAAFGGLAVRRQMFDRAFRCAVRRIALSTLLLVTSIALLGSPTAPLAGEPEMGDTMPGHGAEMGAAAPFARMMETAMSVMDDGMRRAPMTGDPDHDFAAMMIPHHQGAIDMAKAELLYGRNPVLRRLAQEIIVTQNSEITVMQGELQKQGGSPPR
jgi:hypothetical protein